MVMNLVFFFGFIQLTKHASIIASILNAAFHLSFVSQLTRYRDNKQQFMTLPVYAECFVVKAAIVCRRMFSCWKFVMIVYFQLSSTITFFNSTMFICCMIVIVIPTFAQPNIIFFDDYFLQS